jgi:hypothetical protein
MAEETEENVKQNGENTVEPVNDLDTLRIDVN